MEAGRRGFDEVLALTRRRRSSRRLGFEVTRRERFLDKLMVDCQACPLNLCCDETAMVGRGAAAETPPSPHESAVAASAGDEGVCWR